MFVFHYEYIVMMGNKFFENMSELKY